MFALATCFVGSHGAQTIPCEGSLVNEMRCGCDDDLLKFDVFPSSEYKDIYGTILLLVVPNELRGAMGRSDNLKRLTAPPPPRAASTDISLGSHPPPSAS